MMVSRSFVRLLRGANPADDYHTKNQPLMLNSPNNPGGYTYKRDELEAIGALLRQHPHVMCCR